MSKPLSAINKLKVILQKTVRGALAHTDDGTAFRMEQWRCAMLQKDGLCRIIANGATNLCAKFAGSTRASTTAFPVYGRAGWGLGCEERRA